MYIYIYIMAIYLNYLHTKKYFNKAQRLSHTSMNVNKNSNHMYKQSHCIKIFLRRQTLFPVRIKSWKSRIN